MSGEPVTRRSVLGGLAAVAVAGPLLGVEAQSARAGAPRLPFREARVRSLLGRSADDVSFSVHDRISGGIYTYNAGLSNCTGSIVKVLVLTTLLRERARSGRGLSSAQRSLAESMIHDSDNEATSSLLRQAGGREALNATAKALGLTHTRCDGSWGRTATTAEDQRLLMDALVGGTRRLSAGDRAYILDLMRHVNPEQDWGVGTVPRGARAAVKNGWVPLSPRGWRVNSIGAVNGKGRDYTIAVLSYDNRTMEQGVALMEAVAAHVWRTLEPSAVAAATPGGAPGAPYWIRPGAALPPHPLI